MYYYAVLDEKNIVINSFSSETVQTGSNLMAITEEQYNNPDLIGLYYDAENNEFITPPVSVLAETSSSKVQYRMRTNGWMKSWTRSSRTSRILNSLRGLMAYLPTRWHRKTDLPGLKHSG